MQALNRALLWGRGERKIDVVDLLAGLSCSDAQNKLVPPHALVAPDKRGRWRRRALGLLVFVMMVGAAAAAFVYLERNPPPARPAAAPEVAPATSENEPEASSNDEQVVAPAQTAPSGPAKAQTKSAQSQIPAQPARAPPRPTTVAAGSRPVLEFDKDTYVATESDGSVRIVVERHGSTQQPVSFRWNLRSNSAEQGTDFAGIGPGTEQIPAGTNKATLTIPLVSDAVVENTEVFLVEIEPGQAGVALGERSHAAVIVVDDD